MFRQHLLRAALASGIIVAAGLSTGCGSISASGLLMKGAMWGGQQLIKRQIKQMQRGDSEREGRRAHARASKRDASRQGRAGTKTDRPAASAPAAD